MIKTFDFVFDAQRNPKLMQEIKDALQNQTDVVVCTDVHKLSFLPSKQAVIVTPLSENSPYNFKVIPKEIKYTAIIKMLNGNWDNISHDEILDVE
ncbi:MAG: hypothetical protein IKT43_02110 [Clostridia bacterium]|nr:hypothetical protein [Clostridia bacterium]